MYRLSSDISPSAIFFTPRILLRVKREIVDQIASALASKNCAPIVVANPGVINVNMERLHLLLLRLLVWREDEVEEEEKQEEEIDR